jgi:lipooligosaccharide transport system permease protein
MYLLGLAVGLAALIQVPVISHGREVGYLVFVAPALLVTAAIAVASEEMTYPVMAGFKWRRYFYGFNASSLSSPQIAHGVIAGATARMFVAVGAYYLFLWIFDFFVETVPHPETGWLSIPVGVAAGLAFGIPLMAYAGSIQDDKGQFALVQRFIFMPMFLFSGTFYPLETLPVALQWIGWVSPLWHGAELGRVATYGADIAPGMIVLHVVYLIVLMVAGYLWGRRIFIERLAK